ncbi:MAG: peptidase Ste24p [Deltaproteobacteria bacterium]|nr:peptidase Ste24p [Deltaproteobacteria bacterium]
MEELVYRPGFRMMNDQGIISRISIIFIAAVLSVMTAVPVEAVNPFTSTEYDPVLIGEQSEIEIGKKTDQQIRQKYRVSTDAALNQRINAIGQRLAANSGRKINYTFTVLDDEMVNAFAAPGGFIYITTGLLKRLKNDNQIAAVLGHEIGHVVEKHSLKTVQRQMLAQFGLQIMGLLLGDGGLSQSLLLKASEISASLLLLKNSRVNELQSDVQGVRIMRASGYNPRAMIDVQRMLLAQSGGNSSLAILSTHPPSQERIDMIQKAIDDPNFSFESRSKILNQ